MELWLTLNLFEAIKISIQSADRWFKNFFERLNSLAQRLSNVVAPVYSYRSAPSFNESLSTEVPLFIATVRIYRDDSELYTSVPYRAVPVS